MRSPGTFTAPAPFSPIQCYRDLIGPIYLSAFSRLPSQAEMSSLLASLNNSEVPAKDARPAAKTRQQALEDLLWAVLTSKEFLFNH